MSYMTIGAISVSRCNRAVLRWNVPLPKSFETPAVKDLMAIVSATTEVELSGWPGVRRADCAKFGQFICLMSFADFNLRRVVEAASATGVIKETKVKAQDLKIGKVGTAVQSLPDMEVKNKRAIGRLQELRTLRNLLAHFAVKRFPHHDAYVFFTKDAGDFRDMIGSDPEPDEMMTVVVEHSAFLVALSELAALEKWLSGFTFEMLTRFKNGVGTAAA